MMKLSEQMIEFRARERLSMQDAAKQAGISLQTWAHVEREIQDPSRLTEQKIRILIEEDK